jgi:hypothetical protein
MNAIARRLRSEVPSARYIGEISVTRFVSRFPRQKVAVIYIELGENVGSKFPAQDGIPPK